MIEKRSGWKRERVREGRNWVFFWRRVVCGFTRRIGAGVDLVGDGYVVDDSCVCYEIVELTKSDFCEE